MFLHTRNLKAFRLFALNCRGQISTELPDIIQLLPDNIANQIAAGEVIQRPASAVKELMENAVDAGATQINLIVQDSGKALIQVTDNGRGMSDGDARMAFERHATSKIRQIEDLFCIRTMGFRGEALASIAAVAQVVLHTKQEGDELGTLLEIENSRITLHQPAAWNRGTSIAMKNLFFNVPARRNFLKSNPAEMRHVVEEFIRIALGFPEIFFSLTHNGQQVFHLEKGSLKQRIVQLMGNHLGAKLVAVQENTDYLRIYGFVGKPEAAKKTRGDQYLFVNNRFIRSAYLNHAVMSAFAQMIPAESFPLYVLFIDLDPSELDINVHPTKQEIKFEDEKIVYAFVQAAVKHALAQFSITPTLDFDLDPAIQQLEAVSQPPRKADTAKLASSSLYKTFTQKNQAHLIDRDFRSDLPHWRDDRPKGALPDWDPGSAEPPALGWPREGRPEEAALTQLLGKFILAPSATGFLLIDQQSAHERILYERYLAATEGKKMAAQRSFFPATIQLSPPDAALLTDLLEDLEGLGYLIESSGDSRFVIQGSPAETPDVDPRADIEFLLEQSKHSAEEGPSTNQEKLIRSLSRRHSIKSGKTLTEREMKSLVADLFACSQPNTTPWGNPTFVQWQTEMLEKMFGR